MSDLLDLEKMKAEIKHDEDNNIFRWIATAEEVKPLIAEVEQTRSERDQNAYVCKFREKVADRFWEQIESLTKERDGLKEELRISQGIKEGSYTAPKEGWTCFHCGVTFRKPGAASDHFGEVPRDKAKCQYHDMDVEKLEKQIESLTKERDELSRLNLDNLGDHQELQRQFEKLEAENAELDEQMQELAKMGDEKAAEIQADLTASEKKVEELEIRLTLFCTCPDCAGIGHLRAITCARCKGSGRAI